MIDIKINDNFRQLPRKYLFSEVASRLKEYKETHPDVEVIRMDIGDVTRPVFPIVEKAMQQACRDEGEADRFHGYGPEQGYSFLRDKIAAIDYQSRGIDISPEDIFISDGAKSDLGNIGDLLMPGAVTAIADPGYPVYQDAAVIDGRAGHPEHGRWSNIVYLNGDGADSFVPCLPTRHVDVAILCSPHNPTGTCMTLAEVQKWVDYARKEGTLLIFDSAYESYIRTPGMARSIYEAEGAKEVAIEIRSFSKSAGFTGLRCGYTVVPVELKGVYADGSRESLNILWNRRQCTKFNGASYIVQRGAEALYTAEGQKCIRETTDYYLSNARLIYATLKAKGFDVWGGTDSPYIWARHKKYSHSWELFKTMLEICHVSVTPGVGFGHNGEGFIRLTGFNSDIMTRRAMERIETEF